MKIPIIQLLNEKELIELKNIGNPPLNKSLEELTVSELYDLGYNVIEDNSIVGESLGVKVLKVLHNRWLKSKQNESNS